MKSNLGSKKIISIMLITLLLLFATKVYAANDNYTATISASGSTVKRGNSVAITIRLKDIEIKSGEKGIGAYTANMKFDSSVLEYVSTNGTTKWEAPFYQSGLITGHTKDGKVVNTSQAIGTIVFKVKDNAKLGETTISLTNFLGSTAESDIATSNQSIKIVIEEKDNGANSGDNDNNNNNNQDNDNNNGGNSNDNQDNENNDNQDNENNNGENNNNSNNSNTNKKPSTSNGVDTSIKQGVLPQTGATDIIIFTLIGIGILLVIILLIRIIWINRKRQ